MAIEDIARQLGNGLGETLAVTPTDAPHVRYATVDAVNTDGTLDVTIDGTTLRGVCATTGCVGAAAGMRCVVLRQGPLATVIGLIASTELSEVITTEGGLQGKWLLVNGGTASITSYGTATFANLVVRDGVEVNGKYLPDGNVSIGYWTNSSAVTTTSTTTIGSLTHTSKTGHVLIAANMILATSRYTSSMQVYGQNTLFIHRRTNITSPTRIDGIAQDHPTRGAAITYTLRMNSQDSGTTATFPAYNTAELIVIDIS